MSLNANVPPRRALFWAIKATPTPMHHAAPSTGQLPCVRLIATQAYLAKSCPRAEAASISFGVSCRKCLSESHLLSSILLDTSSGLYLKSVRGLNWPQWRRRRTDHDGAHGTIRCSANHQRDNHPLGSSPRAVIGVTSYAQPRGETASKDLVLSCLYT